MATFYAHEVEHHLRGGKTLRFSPRGPMHLVEGTATTKRQRGSREDTVHNWGPGGLAARVFVGLNVGETPTYTVEDVVNATKELRRKYGKPDSTFIAQKGLYTEPAERGGRLIEENSVQIIIFETEGLSVEAFTEQIVELATGLRQQFDQDSVIVEIQKGGVSQSVLNVAR